MLQKYRQEVYVHLLDCDLASYGSFGSFILYRHIAHVITTRKFTFQNDSAHIQPLEKCLIGNFTLGQNFVVEL